MYNHVTGFRNEYGKPIKKEGKEGKEENSEVAVTRPNNGFHYDEQISARGNTPCVVFRKEVLHWFINKTGEDAMGTNLKMYPTTHEGEKLLIIKVSKEQEKKITE